MEEFSDTDTLVTPKLEQPDEDEMEEQFQNTAGEVEKSVGPTSPEIADVKPSRALLDGGEVSGYVAKVLTKRKRNASPDFEPQIEPRDRRGSLSADPHVDQNQKRTRTYPKRISRKTKKWTDYRELSDSSDSGPEEPELSAVTNKISHIKHNKVAINENDISCRKAKVPLDAKLASANFNMTKVTKRINMGLPNVESRPHVPILGHEIKQQMKYTLTYKCKTCNIFFNTETNLSRHFLNEHSLLSYLKCVYCPAYFLSSQSRNEHIVDHHKHIQNTVTNKLPVNSDRTFSNVVTFPTQQVTAIVNATKDGEFVITDLEDGEIINRVTPNETPEQFCQKLNNQVAITKKVTANYNSNNAPAECLFKCNFCNVKFSNSLDLNNHEETHGKDKNDKSNNCTICKIELVNSCSLKLHFSQAGKHNLLMKNKLENPEFSLDGSKVLKCPICEIIFTDPKKFYAHCVPYFLFTELTQTCESCNIVFDQKFQYTEHCIKIHHSSKYYKCRICLMEYIHYNSLKKHVNRDHNMKCIYCMHCEQNVLNTSYLANHLKLCYKNLNTKICDLCEDGRMHSLGSMISHTQEHFKQLQCQLQCEFCLNYFYTEHNYKAHLKVNQCHKCELRRVFCAGKRIRSNLEIDAMCQHD